MGLWPKNCEKYHFLRGCVMFGLVIFLWGDIVIISGTENLKFNTLTLPYLSLREFVRICASLRESAWICASLREFVRVYTNLCEFMRICASLRASAGIYTSLREFMQICARLRKSAWVYLYIKGSLTWCQPQSVIRQHRDNTSALLVAEVPTTFPLP